MTKWLGGSVSCGVITGLLALAFTASAATRTWTGASPTSGNWTIPGNWDGGASSPSNGDDLIFPASASRLDNTNNFANFRARSLTFSGFGGGFHLYGNAVTVSNGINGSHSFGSNAIHFDVTLGASITLLALNPSGSVGIVGDVNLGTHTLTISNRAPVLLSGTLSGAGNLTKYGTNVLTVAGLNDNIFTGTTTVLEGALWLNKSANQVAISGDLVIGTDDVFDPANIDFVRLLNHGQIDNVGIITVKRTGRVELNNFNEAIGELVLEGGDIETGTGTLTLGGDVLVNPPYAESSRIHGRLSVGTGTRTFTTTGVLRDLDLVATVSGTANIVFAGEGRFLLRSSNSFSGSLTLNDGEIYFYDDYSLGATNGPTILTNGARMVIIDPINAGLYIRERLIVGGLAGVEEMQFGSGNFVWAGDIVLGVTNTISQQPGHSVTLLGSVSGPGGLRTIGGYTLIMAGNSANTYSGETWIREGTLVLTKTNAVAIAGNIYLGNGQTPAMELMEQLRPNQIADTARVLVATTARWNLNGNNETVGALAADFASDGGDIVLGSATLTVQQAAMTGSSFAGIISGTGGFTKRGAGWFALEGDNTYTGPTLVEAGELEVNDDQPASPVTVLTGARLTGVGTVGHVYSQPGSTFVPGYDWVPYATSLDASNVVMDAGSTLRMHLPGPGSNTLLNVRGTVTLNDPTLAIHFDYVPKVGDTFTLIQNDGAEPIAGKFAGLPGGFFYGPGGIPLQITYNNDVTLRVVSPGMTNLPPGIGVTVLGGNGNGVIDPNECNQLRITLFNNSTNAQPAFHAALASEFPGLIVTQPDSDFPSIAPGATGTNISLFQIVTPPGFVCGTNLPFLLTIYTPSNSGYQIPLSLPTGSPGTPVRFDNNVAEAIPDGGTIESVVEVSFTGHLAEAAVGLHIEHPLTSDLDVTLVAPDGTQIPLVADLGTGANFGSGCGDPGRTWLRDGAAVGVASADAPFVGTFRPVGYLSAVRGQPASLIEGKWKLRVSDDTHFNLGTLRCWSLLLSPAVCTDGGGPCDRCPGVIAGSVTAQSPVAIGYVNPSADPANCFSNQPCNSIADVPVRYTTHTFTNLSEQDTCVAVTLTPDCGTNFQVMLVAAYLNSFNPAAPCQNFIGSSHWNYETLQASIKVPAHAVFQIVVFPVNTPYTCNSYSLQVDSPSLCPVPLNITPVSPNAVRLDWPGYAVGYGLEVAAGLPANAWGSVTNQPVVNAGRFVVTNTMTISNGFYRLRKD